MPAELSEGGIIGGCKVDALAGFEAEWHFGVGGSEEGNDGFFVAKGARPFLLADGGGGDAIRRHDKDESFAGADGFGDLFIPVLGRAEMAFIEPDGEGGWAGGEIVGEFKGEREAVYRGVADKEVVGHAREPVDAYRGSIAHGAFGDRENGRSYGREMSVWQRLKN